MEQVERGESEAASVAPQIPGPTKAEPDAWQFLFLFPAIFSTPLIVGSWLVLAELPWAPGLPEWFIVTAPVVLLLLSAWNLGESPIVRRLPAFFAAVGLLVLVGPILVTVVPAPGGWPFLVAAILLFLVGLATAYLRRFGGPPSFLTPMSSMYGAAGLIFANLTALMMLRGVA